MNDTSSYYQQQRTEILSILTKEPRHVLDIGCGKGGVASTIRHRYKGVLITGFDKFKDETFDYLSAFTAFHNFDLTEEWPTVDYSSFDLVLMLDVLEHLSDPQAVLKKLSQLTSSEAKVVISLPNFHYYSNLYEIVKSGRFQYKQSGILDRTHLRFYGQQDARELIGDYFTIESYLPNMLQPSILGKFINLTVGAKYAAYQNIFLCSPKKH